MRSLMIRRVGVVASAIASVLAAALGAQQDVQDDDVRAARGSLTVGQVRALLEGAPYIPGRVIVKFKPGVGLQARTAVLAAVTGAKDDERPRHADFSRATIPHAADVTAATRLLSQQADVEYAEPDYVYALKSRPNDPSYGRQWNLHQIGMEAAWDINPGGTQNVIVAVIDSGVAFHTNVFTFLRSDGRFVFRIPVPFQAAPDLARANRFVEPWDFVWGDRFPVDMRGHGTHVAGTIAQLTNNNAGLAGMAYNVRLMPLKVCLGAWDVLFMLAPLGVSIVPPSTGGCLSSETAEAIRYAADRDAKVINLSLGGAVPSNAQRDAIRYAISRGVFVAAAMGNEYEVGNPVEYPAAFAASIDGAMSVGAVGRELRRAIYSNTGSHTEIVAPGGDTRQGGTAGLIYQQGIDPIFFNLLLLRPRFDIFWEQPNAGTSMATPHVAGLAALLYSQGISNPAAIEAAIKRFARDLGPAGRDDEYGYGLIDPRATLRGLGVAQ